MHVPEASLSNIERFFRGWSNTAACHSTAVTHIALIDPVRDAFAELRLGTQYGPVIGIVMLACLALYAVPRTAILGVVLLTGYFGSDVGIAVWAAL